MRILLDENISGHTERFLKKAGHEVIRSPQHAKDHDILAFAAKIHAVIITRDSDFLSFLPTSLSGIIYIQIHPPIVEHITDALRKFLTGLKHPLQGSIVILSRNGYEVFR